MNEKNEINERNKLIENLVNVFKDECQKYSDNIEGVVNYKQYHDYLKGKKENGIGKVVSRIIFKGFSLNVIYRINSGIIIPVSTLEIRIDFEKAYLPLEYSFYDILYEIDKNNFNCYTIPYISSKKQLKDSIKYIIDEFLKYKDKIQEFAESKEKITLLEKKIENRIYIMFKEHIFKSMNLNYVKDILNLYYILDIANFTSDEYYIYLEGKYKKYIKVLNKKKQKTDYEKRLLEHVKKKVKKGIKKEEATNKNKEFIAAKKEKSSSKDLIPMLLSTLVIIPIAAIVYAFIFYITTMFLNKGTMYVAGQTYFSLYLPSLITGIIGSWYARKLAYKIIYRKNCSKIIMLDTLSVTDKINKNMDKFCQFIIAASIVWTMLSANNLDMLQIEGEFIPYTDVKCVYKTNGIMNDLGFVVDNKSAVIVLNNNEQINLYYSVDTSEVYDKILPILESKNIPIKQVELVEDVEKELKKENIQIYAE